MSLIPKDYFDARNRFRTLTKATGGRLASFPVTSTFPTNGILSVDTAYFGNDHAHNVLVMVTGVHGVEGYAGSACIQHFLRHLASRYMGGDTAYLLIHALNPWGFANDSRVTEENIDLNRNFVNFVESLPSSVEYSRFHDILCEDYQPGLSRFFNDVRLLRAILGSKNRRAFQEAVTAGQYQYKNGLFYGGNQVTQNQKILSEIMQTHLRPGQNVRCLDIHSGLGKKGQGTLVTHLPTSSPKFRRLSSWLDRQITSTTSDTNISATVSGHLPGHLEALFGETCFAITLEFGVAGSLFTLNALRADNWLRTTQNKQVAALRKTAVKKRMRRAFLCNSPSWERAVIMRFEWTLDQLNKSFHDV